ncbi:carbohydrate kinase [Candidatus Bathyarchaeota archaeon]|nr:carbohydrate kinase [Candidatus Bathyarchaeota archaeon]
MAMEKTIILAHDVGTSGNKTGLIKIEDKIEMIGSKTIEYGILHPENIPHGVEQKAGDWWNAICEGSKQVLKQASIQPTQVDAITFSCQTQGAVFVDEYNAPLDNPYIWMDARAVKELEDGLGHGPFKIQGMNLRKLIQFLRITGGAPGTAKDPLWKYWWFKRHKPDRFKKLHKMLDVKDYLIAKCTGNFYTTLDYAQLVWLFDTRPGKLEWHSGLCDRYDIPVEHLPIVKRATETAGPLLENAARDMGLVEGIPVNMGGADASCIPVGSGSTAEHDTHVYTGTSGWVISNVRDRMVNLKYFEVSLLGAIPGFYNFIAEQETSGACLAWAKDHLADLEVERAQEEGVSVYDFLNEMVGQMPPGSNGLIFTPWMHGNRAPREDPHVRGAFFNISLQTHRREMFRAILEGDALHKRWMLEGFHEKKIPLPDLFTYIGGGAKSDEWCQIMADVLKKRIQPVRYAQDGGAIGAALIAAVGLGITNWENGKMLIPMGRIFEPRKEHEKTYDKLFVAFKQIYENNKSLYKFLNP